MTSNLKDEFKALTQLVRIKAKLSTGEDVDFDMMDILSPKPLPTELASLPLAFNIITCLAVEARANYEEMKSQYLSWEAQKVQEAHQEIQGRVTEIALATHIQSDPEYLQRQSDLNASKTLWRKLWFGCRTAIEIKASILGIANPDSRAKMEKILGDLQLKADEMSETPMEEQGSPEPDESPSPDPGDNILPDNDGKEGFGERVRGEIPLKTPDDKSKTRQVDQNPGTKDRVAEARERIRKKKEQQQKT